MQRSTFPILGAVVLAAVIAIPASAQSTTASPKATPKKTQTVAAKPQRTVTVKEETAGLAAQATISADSAQKLALAQVRRGIVREAELEMENGTLVYSYDIKVAGRAGLEEVVIDAKTGALVSKKHETAKAEAREKAAAKMKAHHEADEHKADSAHVEHKPDDMHMEHKPDSAHMEHKPDSARTTP